MRGDPLVELRGVSMVGRKSSSSDDRAGEEVMVEGLTLRMGSDGLTVESRDATAAHTVKWERVRSLVPGTEARLRNGIRARRIEVDLDDRSVQFLVPLSSLRDNQVDSIKELVARHVVAPNGAGAQVARPEVKPPLSASDDSNVAYSNPRADEPQRKSRPQVQKVPPVSPPASPLKAVRRTARKSPTEKTVAAAPTKKVVAAPPTQPTGRLGKLIPLRRESAGMPSATNVALPPPPPSSSRVSMPPRPVISEKPRREIDPELLSPLAVPPARLMEEPSVPTTMVQPVPATPTLETHLEDVPTFDPSIVADRKLPALPPPPPGQSLRLPTAPDPPRREPEPVARRRPPPPPALPPPPPVAPNPIGETVPQLPPEPQEEAPPVVKHRRPRKRSRVIPMLAVVALLLIGGIAGAVFGLSSTGGSHAATPPPHTVPSIATRATSGGSPVDAQGPGPSATLSTVAGSINLELADFPGGWSAGQQPWGRVAAPDANAQLAGCLGIPESDLGVLLGAQQSSGPSVESSGWFESATSATDKSGLQSVAVLETDSATENFDLSAFASSEAPGCLQGWFGSLDVNRDPIVDAPTMSTVSFTPPAGVRAAGFETVVTTRVGTSDSRVEEELFVLGSGRVEVSLEAVAVGGSIDSSVLTTELKNIESRLQAAVAS